MHFYSRSSNHEKKATNKNVGPTIKLPGFTFFWLYGGAVTAEHELELGRIVASGGAKSHPGM